VRASEKALALQSVQSLPAGRVEDTEEIAR
jgi:hypothetical protein